MNHFNYAGYLVTVAFNLAVFPQHAAKPYLCAELGLVSKSLASLKRRIRTAKKGVTA
jgi:hypothetical protein